MRLGSGNCEAVEGYFVLLKDKYTVGEIFCLNKKSIHTALSPVCLILAHLQASGSRIVEGGVPVHSHSTGRLEQL